MFFNLLFLDMISYYEVKYFIFYFIELGGKNNLNYVSIFYGKILQNFDDNKSLLQR